MIDRLERHWVSLVTSERYRRLMKEGLGSALLRSAPYRSLTLVRRRVTSDLAVRAHPERFDTVDTFCAFVGQAKSGGTLIASLLDAHPDIALADEADALQYLDAGFSREQIYHLLLKSSRRQAMSGRVTARRLGGYSFQVEGQWQGRFQCLKVVGDCRAGEATRRLFRDPDLLGRLRGLLEDEIKLIQVIRNPYDPIALMTIRGKRSLENAIQHYFSHCEMLATIRRRLRSGAPALLWSVRYEDFVRRPLPNLEAICHFLGVAVEPGYLAACAAILRPDPERSRYLIAWDPRWVDAVAGRIAQYDFLEGYTFET